MKTIILKAAGLQFSLITVYLLVGWASYSIPTRSLFLHLKESLSYVADITGSDWYHRAYVDLPFTQLDYFTDSGWLLMMLNKNETLNSFEQSLSNTSSRSFSELGQDDSLVLDPKDILLSNVYAYENLGEVTDSNVGGGYSRYWHGDVALLRPLFLFMNYKHWRVFNVVLMSLFILFLSIRLHRKLGAAAMLGFLFALLYTGCPFVVGLCFQFSSVYWVLLIALFYLLYARPLTANGCFLFFWAVGSFTNYLDHMTAPVLTLCIPAFIYMRQSSDARFKTVFQITLAWGLGFALTWVAKWAIATCVLGQNVFAQALVNPISYPDNYLYADYLKRLLPVILLLAFCGVFIVVCFCRHISLRRLYVDYGSWGLIAAIPAIYVMLFQRQTLWHYWFTFRVWGVWAFLLVYVCVDLWQRRAKAIPNK